MFSAIFIPRSNVDRVWKNSGFEKKTWSRRIFLGLLGFSGFKKKMHFYSL